MELDLESLLVRAQLYSYAETPQPPHPPPPVVLIYESAIGQPR
jgi:hypothetical protein